MCIMNILTLGESLARFSSFDGQRLSNSTQLNLTYGGAEGNVAVNLALLGHSVSHATKIPDNLFSNNLIALLRSQNVNLDHVIYGGERLGTYFVEGGVGLRPSKVIYDRAYSSIAMMESLEWDLDTLFRDIDLFHITGITLALSKNWHKLGAQLIKEAYQRDIKISFDMNFRSALWTLETAKEVFQSILPYVTYLSASKLDAIAFMNIKEKESMTDECYIRKIAEKYSNIEFIYGTFRKNKTPNTFKYQGFLYQASDNSLSLSKNYNLDEVIDRVGAGDSYSAGVLDGIILDRSPQDIVDFAAASAVLKHTIRGDINRFTRKDVEQFMTNTQNIIR